MADEINVSVAGVLTQQRKEFDPGQDVAALAAAAGIPVIGDPAEIPDCDILYSVQYHKILPQSAIEKATQIAVNLHMATLPEYRGCNQFSFAIMDDKKEFGTTIHRIDARIDHGDLLFEKRFPVPENCWVEQLYNLTFDASITLFRETLEAIVSGHYKPISQQDLIAGRGTSIHYRHDIAALKKIDFSWDAGKISRHVRATSMPGFEPPYAIAGGRKIYLITSPE